jgi:hypothetical protein
MSPFNYIFYFFLMRSILRQIVAVLALVGITTSMVPATFAVTYTAQAAADKLAASGFIVDQSANSAAYRLADNLLRQEAVGTAANVLGLLTTPLSSYVCQNKFSDVTAASGWVCRAAELAAAAGLTNAANTTFRPKDNLTRFEALVFALRAAGLVPSNGLTQAALIQLGVDNGLITSSAGFNANASATRGEFFQYVVRGLDAAETPELCDILGICPNPNPTPTPGTGGAVTVKVSSNTPAPKFTPVNAQNVVFAAFDFVGGSKSTVITSVKLNRTGVGSRNDFAGVYLRSNNIALTNERTVNSDNVVEFGNLNLVVGVGQTVRVEVVANMASSASNNSQNAFSIASASMVNSTGTIGGMFPLTGNLMTMSSVGVASMKITSTVKASDPTLGAVGATLATLKFENDDVNATDHRVQVLSLALEQTGTIDASAIANLGLYEGSTKVASMQTLDGDDYILVFVPNYILNDGNSKTLDLKGDVISGKAGDTINFALNDNSDVNAVDVDADVGAFVRDGEGTASTFGSSTYYIDGTTDGTVADPLTLKAGDVTLSFNGPATKDIAWWDKEVVLLESTISSGRNVEVKAIDVKLTLTKANNSTITQTAIKNIKIVDEAGSTLMGPVSDLVAFGFDLTDDNDTDSLVLNGATTAFDTKSFTDSFYINAGQSRKVRVVVELDSTSDTDLTGLTAQIDVGASSFKDTATNKFIAAASVTPTTVGGKTHNVVTNSLTLATASNPTATTIIKGSKDVKVAGVSLKAGDAGALTVRSMKFTFGGTAANTAKAVYSNTRLVDSTGATLDTSNITDGTPDTVTFDGFNYAVPKGTTQIIYVVADVLDTATATDLRASIADVADVTVIEADGDAITPTGTPTGNLMTIETAGTFIVSPLTADSRNQVVQSGTTGKEVARYEFKASKEKFNVKKLTFDFTGDDEIIKSLKLKIGSVEKTEFSITAGEVTFSNINAEIDGTVQVSLFADFNSMNSDGTDTGKQAKFLLAQDSDAAETEVVGVGSSSTINDLTAFTDSSANKTYIARASKLTFAKVTSGLVADLDSASSDAVVYAGTIQNSSGSSVDLGKLSFNFDITDADAGADFALADVKLWLNNSIVTSSEATYSATTVAADTTITVTLNSNNKGILSAGSSVDFKVTVDGTTQDGDTLAVDLLDDDTNNFIITAKKAMGNIVDGEIDVDADGTATTGDADDDLSVVVLNGLSYAVINGQVDVDGDGVTASDADDDLATVSINGSTYNIVNGAFDIDADATTASDSDDDLTVNRRFIWSDKAIPTHSDTTADWANGYGLNMDVMTNNAFTNKQ